MTTVPTAPNGLTASGANSVVNLSWSAPTSNGGSAITGYKIYRGTASGSESLLTSVGTATSYGDSAVVSGTTYYYKVTAVNGVGEGATSNEASAGPSKTTVPTAPRNLTARSASYRGVTLAWSAPTSNGGSPVSSYTIYRSTRSGQETMYVVVSCTSGSCGYTDSGTNRSSTYYYEVAATNSVGRTGPVSNQASARAQIALVRRTLALVSVMLVLVGCGSGTLRPAVKGGPTSATGSGPTTTTTPAPTSTSTTSKTGSGGSGRTGGMMTTSTTTVPEQTPTTTTTLASGSGPVSATGTSGGLTIVLTATPGRGPTSTPVTFTLRAVESNAPGALHYQVTYGDGGMDSNVTPTVCTAGPGEPMSQTWTLTHQYATANSFTVVAVVGVDCSPDKATATLTVSPVNG